MDSSEVLAFLAIWCLLFGVVGGAIWQSKGGSFASGFFICALLGILGIIFVAAAKPHGSVGSGPHGMTRECPFCKSNIRADASVCAHCQRESQPWVFHEGHWWVKDARGTDWWLDERARNWKPLQPTS